MIALLGLQGWRMNQSEIIDSGIGLKMRKIRFVNRKGEAMYLGVSLVLDKIDGKIEPIVIISDLVENLKLKDVITGSITEICSWVYVRGLQKFTVDDVMWIQHFPSSKLFASKLEVLLMEWVAQIETFKFNQRIELEGEPLEHFIELLYSELG